MQLSKFYLFHMLVIIIVFKFGDKKYVFILTY